MLGWEVYAMTSSDTVYVTRHQALYNGNAVRIRESISTQSDSLSPGQGPGREQAVAA